MTYRVVIRPEAELDLQEAYDWYESRNRGLGSEFIRAVDVCMSGLARIPEAYPPIYKSVRRMLVRRFPYSIFYIVEPEMVVILACFHAKRDPKQWKKRLN